MLWGIEAQQEVDQTRIYARGGGVVSFIVGGEATMIVLCGGVGLKGRRGRMESGRWIVKTCEVMREIQEMIEF